MLATLLGLLLALKHHRDLLKHAHISLCVQWFMQYALFAPGGDMKSCVACALALDIQCTVVYLSAGTIGQSPTICVTGAYAYSACHGVNTLVHRGTVAEYRSTDAHHDGG